MGKEDAITFFDGEINFINRFYIYSSTEDIAVAKALYEEYNTLITDAVANDRNFYYEWVDKFYLKNFELYTFTDLENSKYINNQGDEIDLRDYINMTGYDDIQFDIIGEEYLVSKKDLENFFDTEKIEEENCFVNSVKRNRKK